MQNYDFKYHEIKECDLTIVEIGGQIDADLFLHLLSQVKANIKNNGFVSALILDVRGAKFSFSLEETAHISRIIQFDGILKLIPLQILASAPREAALSYFIVQNLSHHGFLIDVSGSITHALLKLGRKHCEPKLSSFLVSEK